MTQQALRIETEAWPGPALVAIPPADRRQALPMSFGQQRMWLLQQNRPDLATDNVPMVFHLRGAVAVARLRASLQIIMARHEVLRTALVQEGEGLWQRVFPAAEVLLPWDEVDLRAVPAAVQEAEVERRLTEEVHRPFDLSRAPLWRARWLRLSAEEQVLALTFHHGVMDEWSMRLFVKEWEQLNREEAPPELPALPVQYADYAVWQRQQVSRGLLEVERNYWRGELEGLPPALDLPTEKARPARPSGRGAAHRFALSPSLVEALRGLARQEGASLFSLMLGAFQVWLHRYSGQDDLLVGTPVANRARPEVQPLIGFFLNTLPLRARLDGGQNFRALLGQVQRRVQGALAHAGLPIEQIVELTAPGREGNQTPLYQVMFVLVEEGLSALELGRAQARPRPVETRTSKNDLTLSIEAVGDAWACRFEYATDLFSAETAARMGRHLTELLRSITEEPEKSISQLNLMPAAERHQVLVEWNQTERNYPRDESLQELFEQQVQRTPGAVVLIDKAVSLSYQELNERANRLAHYLREAGIQRHSRVGVLMERSLDYVIVVIGILKAGASYLPLDLDLPPARLRFLLHDACINTVIGRPEERAEEWEQSHVRFLDRQSLVETVARFPSSNPKSVTAATDVAYIMYTSGSTGEPKGVEVPHRAVIRLVFGNGYLPFDNQQVFLLLAAVEFDASTLELWGPLLHGSKLVIHSKKELELTALQSLIEKHQVTCLWLTSALFNAVIDQQPETLVGVKNLMIGGEALSVSHVRRALQHLPTTQITNGYGPTEATTFTTTFPIPRHLAADAPTIPIGRPIANTQVYILDSQLQPVPVGVRGEIYIGGDGLALGYLNCPDLTATKFIPNPFRPETRLYRTGDIGRYLQDGNIEFLARNDQQVKIRGFRIEPGEIESVLKRHPAVREALVVASQNAIGEKKLLAYLTVTGEVQDRVMEFRRFLEQNLPIHMVPSAFVVLDRFPLTSNGKVDRKALPAPEKHPAGPESMHLSPRTENEQVLAAIWGEVLGLEKVGIHDNFFDLGGHSLAATRVLARVERELGRKFPLKALFRHQTIAEMAKMMNNETATNAAPSRLQVLSSAGTGDTPPLYCFHFLSAAQRLAKHLRAARTVYGVETDLDEELRVWHEKGQIGITLVELAAQCRASIEQAQPKGPYLLAGFCFGGVLAFEVASQLQHRGQEVRLLALLDATYCAGCPPLAMPQVRRWGHHAWRALREGPGYLFAKLRKRLERQKRRRSQLEQMHSTSRASGGESEPTELPRAGFLSQLLISYEARPFAGDVLLFRTVAEPNSFDHDLGEANGWNDVVLGRLQVEDVECNHLDISEEPYVGEVARKLEDYLLYNTSK